MDQIVESRLYVYVFHCVTVRFIYGTVSNAQLIASISAHTHCIGAAAYNRFAQSDWGIASCFWQLDTHTGSEHMVASVGIFIVHFNLNVENIENIYHNLR